MDYFLVSILVYLVALATIVWPSCCKNDDKKKRKKGRNSRTRSKNRNRKQHRKSSKQPSPRQMNITFTPTGTPDPSLNPPTPGTIHSREFGMNENEFKKPITPVQTLSKETADKKATPSAKNSEKEEDSVDRSDLVRCRDYTPQIFIGFDSLFELLNHES